MHESRSFSHASVHASAKAGGVDMIVDKTAPVAISMFNNRALDITASSRYLDNRDDRTQSCPYGERSRG
jgi:hypothetical protein